MQDYKISQLFHIPLKSKRVSPFTEIAWKPTSGGTIKFNCDESSIGAHPCGAIGIVIRDSNSVFLGAISSNIGYASPIDKAMAMSLSNICLKTDSIIVVNAFNKDVGVPWKMRIRWNNCIKFCKSITCSCVHNLREGNMVADALIG